MDQGLAEVEIRIKIPHEPVDVRSIHLADHVRERAIPADLSVRYLIDTGLFLLGDDVTDHLVLDVRQFILTDFILFETRNCSTELLLLLTVPDPGITTNICSI